MQCDEVRTMLLDYGWGADERRRAMLLLRHLETCDACRAAFVDYDALSDVLRPAEGAGDDAAVEPAGGWDAFLDKLKSTTPAVPPPVVGGHRSMRLRLRPPGGRAAAVAACGVLAVGAFQFG